MNNLNKSVWVVSPLLIKKCLMALFLAGLSFVSFILLFSTLSKAANAPLTFSPIDVLYGLTFSLGFGLGLSNTTAIVLACFILLIPSAAFFTLGWKVVKKG